MFPNQMKKKKKKILVSNVEKSITCHSGGLSIFLTGERALTPRREHNFILDKP